jgi:pyruvate,water dikinase
VTAVSPIDCSPVELLGPDTDPGQHLGGKGRALARLVTGGFPIPETGVVTVAAYRAVAGGGEVAALVDAIAGGRETSAARVDDVFARAPVDPELRRSIAELARTVGRGGPIAVRSSATVEDLHGSSFAGQYRSLLDVDSTDPDQVMDAVRQVWASLWHPAPSAYRRAFAIDETGVAMAVVLMRMVPADTAGVVFTVDPGGRDGARVESVEGLGESLVSGQRTPSAWVVPVTEVDGVRRSVPAEAIAQIPTDPGPTAGADAAAAGPLTPAAARALDLALDVERLFDVPQDVEWAAAGDEVLVVQARPITVLDDSDGFDTPIDDHELTTAGIVEMVPGVLAPLRWELNRFLLEEAFRSVLDSVGIIEGDATEDQPFVRRVRGRAAIDFDQLRAVAGNIPGAAAELERQYFNQEPIGPPAPPPDRGWGGRLGDRFRAVRRELQTIRTRHLVVDQADMLVTATVGLRTRRPALEPLDDDELLRYLRRLLDLAARGLTAELGVAAAGGASYRRLELLLAGHLDDRGEGEAAARAVTARSGAAVERDPSASAAVFGGPTWQERGIRPPSPPEPDDDGHERDRDELEARLRTRPGWTRRRILTGQFVDTRIAVLRRTIRDVVEQLRRREATKAAFLELGGETRRVLLEIGRRLAGRGLIDDPPDVELLSTGELAAALVDGRPVAIDVIRHRRNWIGRYEAEGFLPVRFRGVPSREPTPLPTGDRLEGWAASPGRVRGVARVVRGPDDPFDRGEVLVAEATDASWSPLFVRAGAVVVERGGPLSHAAILARELGLPAVLNLPGATSVLDGRTVSVDGDQGVVVIEAPAVDELPATAEGVGP